MDRSRLNFPDEDGDKGAGSSGSGSSDSEVGGSSVGGGGGGGVDHDSEEPWVVGDDSDVRPRQVKGENPDSQGPATGRFPYYGGPKNRAKTSRFRGTWVPSLELVLSKKQPGLVVRASEKLVLHRACSFSRLSSGHKVYKSPRGL